MGKSASHSLYTVVGRPSQLNPPNFQTPTVKEEAKYHPSPPAQMRHHQHQQYSHEHSHPGDDVGSEYSSHSESSLGGVRVEIDANGNRVQPHPLTTSETSQHRKRKMAPSPTTNYTQRPVTGRQRKPSAKLANQQEGEGNMEEGNGEMNPEQPMVKKQPRQKKMKMQHHINAAKLKKVTAGGSSSFTTTPFTTPLLHSDDNVAAAALHAAASGTVINPSDWQQHEQPIQSNLHLGMLASPSQSSKSKSQSQSSQSKTPQQPYAIVVYHEVEKQSSAYFMVPVSALSPDDFQVRG